MAVWRSEAGAQRVDCQMCGTQLAPCLHKVRPLVLWKLAHREHCLDPNLVLGSRPASWAYPCMRSIIARISSSGTGPMPGLPAVSQPSTRPGEWPRHGHHYRIGIGRWTGSGLIPGLADVMPAPVEGHDRPGARKTSTCSSLRTPRLWKLSFNPSNSTSFHRHDAQDQGEPLTAAKDVHLRRLLGDERRLALGQDEHGYHGTSTRGAVMAAR